MKVHHYCFNRATSNICLPQLIAKKMETPGRELNSLAQEKSIEKEYKCEALWIVSHGFIE